MKDKPDGRRIATSELVSKSFGIIMVVLYFFFGTTIIFNTPVQHNIPEMYAIPFGILLYVYGVYRAYKLYRRHF